MENSNPQVTIDVVNGTYEIVAEGPEQVEKVAEILRILEGIEDQTEKSEN